MSSSDRSSIPILPSSLRSDDNDSDYSPVPNGFGFLTHRPRKQPLPPSSCACESAQPFSHEDSRGTQTLLLKEVKDCTHYVAVSYRWTRDSSKEDQDASFIIENEKGTRRPSKASPRIIQQAIRYAADHECAFIWIDQECINQDDRDDKEKGIQSMDLVYRRAKHAIGILGCHIDSQRDVDALDEMAKQEKYIGKLTRRRPPSSVHWADLTNAFERLASDEWFKRAWILQECTCAKMITLVVSCNPDKNKNTEKLGKAYGQIELNPHHFSFAKQHRAEAKGRIDQETFDRFVEASKKLTSIRPATDLLSEPQQGLRYGCNAAQALRFLEYRKNSRPSDRLAIVANLCDYKVRIDTRKVDAREHSFSACLLTLALLNGDISLLYVEDKNHNHHERICNHLGFSWTPPLYACMSKPSNIHEIGSRIRFSFSNIDSMGLHSIGWLWKVDERVGLERLQALFADQWNSHPAVASHDTYLLVATLLWDLLHEIRERGLHHISHALWHCIRSESASEYRPINDAREFHFGEAYEKGLLQASLYHPYGWIIDKVIRDGSLYCGKLSVGLFKTEEQNRVLFDCSAPGYVFTAYNPELDGFPNEKRFRQMPISWVLSHCEDTPVHSPVRAHCERLCRGVFKIGKPGERLLIPLQEVILAWPKDEDTVRQPGTSLPATGVRGISFRAREEARKKLHTSSMQSLKSRTTQNLETTTLLDKDWIPDMVPNAKALMRHIEDQKKRRITRRQSSSLLLSPQEIGHPWGSSNICAADDENPFPIEAFLPFPESSSTSRRPYAEGIPYQAITYEPNRPLTTHTTDAFRNNTTSSNNSRLSMPSPTLMPLFPVMRSPTILHSGGIPNEYFTPIADAQTIAPTDTDSDAQEPIQGLMHETTDDTENALSISPTEEVFPGDALLKRAMDSWRRGRSRSKKENILQQGYEEEHP